MPERDFQEWLDAAIDDVLDCLDGAAGAGVELDPLATIIGRVQARGTELSLDDLPVPVRMLLAGMIGAPE